MWLPTSETELLTALTDKTFQESQSRDAKRQLGDTPAERLKTARNIASLAVDGGLLVIGLEEDKLKGTFTHYPLPLSGEVERIVSVARQVIDPPLDVQVDELRSAADPQSGYLLIKVPASPQAPHMVAGKYYGRGDRQNKVLTDSEVVRHHQTRRSATAITQRLLEQERVRDMFPDSSLGHLFLVAQPVSGDDELALALLGRPGESDSNKERSLRALLEEGQTETCWAALQQMGWRDHGADLHTCTTFDRRPDGLAMTQHGIRSRQPETGVDGRGILDVTFREDGGLRIYLARATDRDGEQLLLLESTVATLTRRLVDLAVVYGQAINFGGSWDLGVLVTGLKGCATTGGAFRARNNFDPPQIYPDPVYTRAYRASTVQLENRPGSVVDKLLGALFRAFGETDRLAPLFTDPEANPT